MKVPFFSLHIPDDLISRTGLQILPKPVPNGQWMCLGTFSGNLVKMLLVQCRVIQVQTCNSSQQEYQNEVFFWSSCQGPLVGLNFFCSYRVTYYLTIRVWFAFLRIYFLAQGYIFECCGSDCMVWQLFISHTMYCTACTRLYAIFIKLLVLIQKK